MSHLLFPICISLCVEELQSYIKESGGEIVTGRVLKHVMTTLSPTDFNITVNDPDHDFFRGNTVSLCDTAVEVLAFLRL